MKRRPFYAIATPEIDSELARLAGRMSRVGRASAEYDLLHTEYRRLAAAKHQLRREHRERGRQPGALAEQPEGPGGTMRDGEERPALLVCQSCGHAVEKRYNGWCEACLKVE